MAQRFTIDDGRKTYELVNKQGKLLGELSLNPSDTNMITRFKEAQKYFASLSDEDMDDDPEAVIEKLEPLVKNKIDEIFGEGVAESFFKITGPFSPMADGKMFLEVVIETLAKIIELETGTRMDMVNKKINKYTAKYHV